MEKDVVEDVTNLRIFVQERVIQNEKYFNDEELSVVQEKQSLIIKIYLLGFLDNME